MSELDSALALYQFERDCVVNEELAVLLAFRAQFQLLYEAFRERRMFDRERVSSYGRRRYIGAGFYVPVRPELNSREEKLRALLVRENEPNAPRFTQREMHTQPHQATEALIMPPPSILRPLRPRTELDSMYRDLVDATRDALFWHERDKWRNLYPGPLTALTPSRRAGRRRS